MTKETSPVVLSQTAPWNARLTNPYRTRYAEVDGRYFEVASDGLYEPWFVSEITADGNWIDNDLGYIAFRLSDARAYIARVAAEPAPEGVVRPTRHPVIEADRGGIEAPPTAEECRRIIREEANRR